MSANATQNTLRMTAVSSNVQMIVIASGTVQKGNAIVKMDIPGQPANF
jgi:hypothetical protein